MHVTHVPEAVILRPSRDLASWNVAMPVAGAVLSITSGRIELCRHSLDALFHGLGCCANWQPDKKWMALMKGPVVMYDVFS